MVGKMGREGEIGGWDPQNELEGEWELDPPKQEWEEG